jgi:hypothetical protein
MLIDCAAPPLPEGAAVTVIVLLPGWASDDLLDALDPPHATSPIAAANNTMSTRSRYVPILPVRPLRLKATNGPARLPGR